MNLRRKAERFLRRLFHRKKRRCRAILNKKEMRLLNIHLQSHHDMMAREKAEVMVVDGQFYESAVEKYTEIMKSGHPAQVGPTITWDDVSAIRVSKIPELLLLLGVRIRG